MTSVLRSLSFSLILAFAAFPNLAAGSAAQPRPGLNCRQGPVTKNYGQSEWLVYSCDDNRSVVITAAPGSPAGQTYFTLLYGDEGYRLSVEGMESQQGEDALAELRAMSSGDIADLIAQTRQTSK